METARIACVRYLNTVPLIEGLEKCPQLDLIPTVPAQIAEMVTRGEADVGLVSLVDAARATSPELALLPVGMIGCDGPTLTVRLYSAVPLDQVQSVHVDTDSHTSIILCQVLLQRLYRIRPSIVPFDARERIVPGAPASASDAPGKVVLDEAWPETVLLIGDKVVTDAPPKARYAHQLDLGEAWKELTGLPFMYAAWACRASEQDVPAIRIAASLLDRQLRHNQGRLDWIITRRAQEHRWPVDLASRYLCQLLRYRIGPRERQGAERFIAEAASLGLLERSKVQWADHCTQAPILRAEAGACSV